MNIARFCKKCLFDRPAAWRSAKLVGRLFYGRIYWALFPRRPLCYQLQTGGRLLLEKHHSFTQAFWPGTEYSPEVTGAISHYLKPGATFIDCGANIGYYSIMARSLVGAAGRVVAIEANPETFLLLERNLKLNNCGEAVHCALSSTIGELELFMPRAGGDVYSSLQKSMLVGNENIVSFRVQGRTLDEVVSSLNIKAVDVIKIDVEGGELDVLRSAAIVMQQFRPIIIIEYGADTWSAFGAKPSDLHLLLEKSNYIARMFDPVSQSLCMIEDAIWSSPYENILLIPKEKHSGP